MALMALVILGGGARAAEDPFLWLEKVNGPRAMRWVQAENAKTLGTLEGDSRFEALYRQALAIGEAEDRLPWPTMTAGKIYNFWRDAAHPRGLMRDTDPADYRNQAPAWSTAFDLDALAQSEKANWVFKGLDCLPPAETRCLLSLSDGGEDAETIREFDLSTKSFPKAGFALPRGKQSVDWLDDDTLLVAREWNPGDVTTSGYPYIVKRLKRGESLPQAVEVFRGAPRDISAAAFTLTDGDGRRVALFQRYRTFWESDYSIETPSGPARLDLPAKATIHDLVAGRLVIGLDEAWQGIAAGSLVSVPLEAALADPAHLHPRVIFTPGPRQSLRSVAATRDRLLVTILDNVRGRALAFTPEADGGWSEKILPLPENSAIFIQSADRGGDKAFLGVSNFLMPPSIVEADLASGTVATLKSEPARFDTRDLVVEQWETTSKDGTTIPYFVVHRADLAMNGSNPTILYAYGGFRTPMTPSYRALLGKLWLERGGVYVLANIRGGGEFGPAWHDSTLKRNRQRIYDDFAAVGQDLIRRGLTSPRRLGIEGGSAGGLLMGVELTQHPELWHAVDIQVPLLDMLRYEKIAAGASWVAEYGSVSNPEERKFLAGMSPYHNLHRKVDYPEPLVWTTTKDDRVGPQHARKFAARMQAMGKPCLFYEVIEGGHGSGANIKEQVHTTALEMMYFIRKLMD